jgi:lipoate synthase
VEEQQKPNTWGHYIKKNGQAGVFSKCSHHGCMNHNSCFEAGYTFRTLGSEKSRVNHYCQKHAEAFAKVHNLTMPE